VSPGDCGVLVLGGPTASGKTSFAIALAQRYDAEIVGADSRQVYRGMPVGTAAPSARQQAEVKHHLVGWIDPYERYSAARFVDDAAAAIADIRARGKRVIVAGGSGFYLRALCGDVELAAEPDPSIRARLLREARTHPVDVLHQWLQARDPRRAAEVSARDPYRTIRALEVDLGRAANTNLIGPPLASPVRTLRTLRATNIGFAKIALRIEPRELAERIARRTDAMLAGGLIEEAERIGANAVAADAVGYREALAYRRGWLTFDELRAALTRATRRYAKRQLTWFRAEPKLTWLGPDDFAATASVVETLGWEVVRGG
jgi:tRNA dimethylallyltransferase